MSQKKENTVEEQLTREVKTLFRASSLILYQTCSSFDFCVVLKGERQKLIIDTHWQH